MKRIAIVVLLCACTALPSVANAGPRHCKKLFTVAMAERASRSVYAGTRHVSRAERQMLGRIQHCQRNPQARGFVRWYEHHRRVLWLARLHPFNGPALASWYGDAGATACGFHATYGFASLFLPCGARITMEHNGHEVTAVMQDHGPYISGRLFDLNAALKAALGCSDLCSVYWH